tara:strand:+ start:189 stop:1331 length:1143 start_codon:yes stop_codon:yes gene_type:complete
MNQKKKYFFIITFLINLVLIVFLLLILERHLKITDLKLREETLKKETHRKQNIDRDLIKKAKQKKYFPIVQPWMFRQYPNLKNTISDVPPLGGKPFRKNYMCNEGYGLIKYKSDRFGYRNNDNIWSNINLKKNKILIIGDSFGAGACVKDNDTISSNLNGISFNLSMPGNDPYMYNSLLNVFAEYVSPKKIIIIIYSNDFIIYENDIYDNKNIKKNKYICNNYLCDEIIKILNNAENFLIQQNLDRGKEPNFFSKLKVYLTFPIIREKIIFIKKKYLFHSITPILNKLIHNSVQHCKRLNCEVTFVYIPNSNSYRPDQIANENKKLLEKKLNESNVSFIDMSKLFKDYTEKEIYALSGSHLSPKGYKLVADEINYKIAKK